MKTDYKIDIVFLEQENNNKLRRTTCSAVAFRLRWCRSRSDAGETGSCRYSVAWSEVLQKTSKCRNWFSYQSF
jgi:hypothetical protein